MVAITSIFAREILDSRGNPTVEVDVVLEDGARGRASVPSGASTGSLEATELRDGDSQRYHGRGVLQAVENVNSEIADAIIGMDGHEQLIVDKAMIALDGSNNKSRLGANAILGVSLGVAQAAALSHKLPLFRYLGGVNSYLLPLPQMNIINGGAHADNMADIQEFMIMPISASSVRDAIRMGAEIFTSLKNLLKKNNHNTNVGDEGGFAPNLSSSKQALDFIMEAIEVAGYKAGQDIVIALDAAATEFCHDGKYHLRGENLVLSSDGLVDYYAALVKSYPIFSIEDPMSEHDTEGWNAVTKELGQKIQLVGDDLFVTNPAIFKRGIQNEVANAILIKPNQIGTLTETLQAVDMAQRAGYRAIISHRSGETEDTSIAHIAVATNCGQIKTGSLSRSDRLAKYNELIRIEEMLGKCGDYAGSKFIIK